MSAAWESFVNQLREGDKDIAGFDFLGSKPSKEAQAIMDSWEDPRGPNSARKQIARRRAELARQGPWYSNKTNVLVLVAWMFTVGVMLGMLLL